MKLKTIYLKREGEFYFLRNNSNSPEIVLLFPITRDISQNPEKWHEVADFVETSNIGTFLVIDKTKSGSATDFFMDSFISLDKQLIIFPRNIEDTLFDSVGEIVLDENMWIIQLHDDDRWSGRITPPDPLSPLTVYFSNFYVSSEKKGSIKIDDYSMPNRIVFSLVPSLIWNRFSRLVRDQKYHVAGSFDFTLNMMAQLTCKFEYQSGFEYYWKDDNWDTRKHAIAHLTTLAESDGWKDWSSPEIANFNRSIDSLAALNCIKDLLETSTINKEVERIINGLKPSFKGRLKYGIFIPLYYVVIELQRKFNSVSGRNGQWSIKMQQQLSLYKFIETTWEIESIENVINVIAYIESLGGFERLQDRFQFWKQSLAELSEEL